MRELDLTEYVANTDLPADDERFAVQSGSLEKTLCPACDESLPPLHDLLDDCGRASGSAFVECPSCGAPLKLETEILVYAFTARRREALPQAGVESKR